MGWGCEDYFRVEGRVWEIWVGWVVCLFVYREVIWVVVWEKLSFREGVCLVGFLVDGLL